MLGVDNTQMGQGTGTRRWQSEMWSLVYRQFEVE